MRAAGAAWLESGGERTECAGLPPEVDVQAHHEELTRTHATIVGN